MTAIEITPPYPVFLDSLGEPLDAGFIYVGTANTDPVNNPISVYWDAALTIPAAQPIRTINGYPSRSGTPSNFYTESTYSMTVKNKSGSLVFTVQESETAGGLFADTSNVAYGDALVGVKKIGTGATAITQHKENETLYSFANFGVAGDDIADDYAEIQAAIDAVSAAGGGVLFAERGRTYKCTVGPIIKDRVTLDLQGSTLHLVLVGDGGYNYGVRLRNWAGVQNGTITVTSSGSVGSQGGIHAPIHIGSMYGAQGTVATPLPDDAVTGFSIKNMTLSTDASGKAAIACLGDVSNGVIENISIPTSSVMSGIHLDWGALGAVNSGDIPGTRTLFNAGTALTTHPRNIQIKNIRMGAMTYASAHGVRLSGVHNISIENFEAEQINFAGFFHTAGDCGYEFAPAALKPSAHKGIRVKGFHVKNANNGNGAFIDCFADNIAAEVIATGYSPLLAPIAECDMVIEQLHTLGSGGASAAAGIRVQNLKGIRLVNCDASLHLNGLLADIAADRVTVEGGRYYSNRSHGVYVHHATDLPEDFKAVRVVCDLNATDSGAGAGAGIKMDYCTRPTIEGCILGGETADATQDYGIQITANTVSASIVRNNVRSTQAAGQGYAMAGSNDFTALWIFQDNISGAGVATPYAGIVIVPVARRITPGGTLGFGDFIAERASLTADITPTAGTWKLGDRIWYASPIFAGYSGTVCTAAGSQGTWHAFGALV